MKYKTLFLSLILLAGLFACSKTDDPAPQVPDSVIDDSIEMFAGDILESKQVTEDGMELWEVKIQNTDGAVVRFYWTVSLNKLHEIDGQESPFNYEVIPGNGLITYSAAKLVAIAAIKNNNLLRWQLEQESDFANKWVYRFEFANGSDEVRVFVDGATGDILEID